MTGEVKAPGTAASLVQSFGTNEATRSYGLWTKAPIIGQVFIGQVF
jgi:hypothetical protein